MSSARRRGTGAGWRLAAGVVAAALGLAAVVLPAAGDGAVAGDVGAGDGGEVAAGAAGTGDLGAIVGAGGAGRDLEAVFPAGALASEPVVPTTGDPSVVDDPLRSLQWYLDRIRVPAAWAVTRGDPAVTIAVIDTGIQPNHPDLAGAFWTDPVTGQNGFDHLEGGFPTYRGADRDWHGTAVAGVAAARADDGYGIAGVAPEVRVMVRRIYESATESTPPSQDSYDAAIEAIEASANAGADVILITWGGIVPDRRLEQAIRSARVPVVAAAGNDGQDLSNDPSVRRYPAMYRLPNLVTVAASDRSNQLARTDRTWTNYGARHVDLAAPGVDIVSIRAGGDHGVFDGTSFAAPQVAAALALGRSVAPGTSANELVGALIGTTRRSAALRGKVASGGVLDVSAFLTAVERPVCNGTYPPSLFADVSVSSVHISGIDCVSWYEVALGVAEGRFAPSRTLTRGEMATFLTRVLERAGYELPEGLEELEGLEGSAPFTDTAGSTHERSIAIVTELGIAAGVGDGRFAPGRTVTRAQMATFLVNTVEVLLDRELVAQQQWFDDIAGNVHEDNITIVRELGITLGTADPRIYDPDTGLARDQMATFLARTLDLLGREGVTVSRP